MNKTLNMVSLDCDAKINELKINSDIKHRLMDLGIIKGSIIRPVFKSPSGDPVAYLVKGTIIALREQTTSKIFVEEVLT